MSFENPIDARNYTYEEWIRFVFDHPVPSPTDRHHDEWYFQEDNEFICDEPRVLDHYTKFFYDPRRAVEAYTDEQIEQALWFIGGTHLRDLLWNEETAITPRAECIAAMPTLFDQFFSDKPLEPTCFMWWDMFRNLSGESPNPHIVTAMLLALERILACDVQHCQRSAIHGLGHLKHLDKECIIRAYLARNPELSEEARAYCEAAIRGEVL